MFVADTHGNLMQRDVSTEGKMIDLIIFLGDNTLTDIEIICDMFPDIKKIGVLGNHDIADGENFRYYGIENISLKTVEIGGIIFFGYGGSVKYKNEISYAVHTQKEASDELKQFGVKADIFITHDKPKLELNVREIEEKTSVQKGFWIFKKTIERTVKKQELFYEEGISQNAHEGTIAIGDYIKEKKPSYHFYGHIHTPSETYIGNTLSKCIYRVEIVGIK